MPSTPCGVDIRGNVLSHGRLLARIHKCRDDSRHSRLDSLRHYRRSVSFGRSYWIVERASVFSNPLLSSDRVMVRL